MAAVGVATLAWIYYTCIPLVDHEIADVRRKSRRALVVGTLAVLLMVTPALFG
jgi:hypothetical protein